MASLARLIIFGIVTFSVGLGMGLVLTEGGGSDPDWRRLSGDELGGPQFPRLDGPAGGHRTGLEWCIEVEPEDDIHVQLEAKARFDELLPSMAEEEKRIHDDIRSRGGYPGERDLPLVVESGCPIGSSILVTGERSVENPGRFSVLIYILPKREIERHFGSEGYRLTTEEITWSGDVGTPVTSGLYLMPEEVLDANAIKYWLYELAGLGCYRQAEVLLRFQTPPAGPLNASEGCFPWTTPGLQEPLTP